MIVYAKGNQPFPHLGNTGPALCTLKKKSSIPSFESARFGYSQRFMTLILGHNRYGCVVSSFSRLSKPALIGTALVLVSLL